MSHNKYKTESLLYLDDPVVSPDPVKEELEAPYFLILDTNAWVTERMLQSAVGNAILYALTADNAVIVLPEIVETEVGLVLGRLAGKATEDIRKNAELLRQISGHRKLLHPVPTINAIQDGIAKRWRELDGAIVRAPFDIEQARAALRRVLDHSPPSGENNEQFRDCCIWATALEFARTRTVHLVTSDSAFYRKGGKTEIAEALQRELEEIKLDIKLHQSVERFLEKVSKGTIQELERNLICEAILEAVTPRAREIASERASSRTGRTFELGEMKTLAINGYATPKQSVVAVTFEISFNLNLFERDGQEESRLETNLSLEGSCSYDPGRHETSEVIIRSWSQSVKGANSYHGDMSLYDPTFEAQIVGTRYV